MFKYCLLYIISIYSLLFPKVVNLTAEEIKIENSIIIGKNINLDWNKYNIKSKYLIFDKKKSLIFLKKNVYLKEDNSSQIEANSLKLYTKTKNIFFKDIIYFYKKQLWISSNKAEKSKNNFKFFEGSLSTCNIKNFSWRILFKECSFNQRTKNIKFKNITFELFKKKIFSLDHLEPSQKGIHLLIPTIKFKINEGIIYEQPIILIKTDELRLKSTPIYKSFTGYGLTVDSIFHLNKHSSISGKIGYFNNKPSYIKANNVKRDNIGVNFLYKNSNVHSKIKSFNSKLYFNIFYINNTNYSKDFILSNESGFKENNLLFKSNYFIYDKFNYFGIYNHYNLYFNNSQNGKIIQNLPTLHYHRFLTELKKKTKIFYSLDMKISNIIQKNIIKGDKVLFNLPIQYNKAFFNNYLNITFFQIASIKRLNLNKDEYSNLNILYKIKAYNDLINNFNNYTHIINSALLYKKNFINIESSQITNLQQIVLSEEIKDSSLELLFTQSLFYKKSNQIIFHKFNVDFNKKFDLTNMLNNIEFSKKKFKFFNRTIYNKDSFNLFSLGFDYKNKNITTSLIDTIRTSKDFKISNNFIIIKNSVDYSKNKTIYFKYDFDLKNKFNHIWDISWEYKKNCISFKLGFGEERIPNKINYFINKNIHFNFKLILPF